MKRFACFLVLALLSAPDDDAWAVTPVSPSAPLVDDKGECLPVPPQSGEDDPASYRGPLRIGQKSSTAEFPIIPGPFDVSHWVRSFAARSRATVERTVPKLPSLKHQTALPFVQRGMAFELPLTTPFSAPLLYLFMSLQI
jgi:hypothetical protein